MIYSSISSSISNKHSFCTYKSPPTKHHKRYIFEIVPSFPLPYSRTTSCLKGEEIGWEGGPGNSKSKLRSKHTEMHWGRSAGLVADTTPQLPHSFHHEYFRGLLPLAPCLCHSLPTETLFKKPSRSHRNQVITDNAASNRVNQNPAGGQ